MTRSLHQTGNLQPLPAASGAKRNFDRLSGVSMTSLPPGRRFALREKGRRVDLHGERRTPCPAS